MDIDASKRLAKALISAYNNGADAVTVADAVHVSRPVDGDFLSWLKVICRQVAVLHDVHRATRKTGAKAVVR